MELLKGVSLERQTMTEQVFSRILVPIDFSRCAEAAWGLAERLAMTTGAELILLHVLTETPLYSEMPWTMGHVKEVYAAARKWVEEALEAWVARARASGLSARAVLREGVPYREVIALAVAERADLVVIGTHGRGGIDRALLGSVADRLVRSAPCPVLTVREPE
jgi:nucleotide-binding universal stress UspA family protein